MKKVLFGIIATANTTSCGTHRHSIIRKLLDALNKEKIHNGDLADCQIAVVSACVLNCEFKNF